jgi:transcriptional regulator with XRE-family HTH domain
MMLLYYSIMKSNQESIRKVLAQNVKNYRTMLRYSQEKLAEKSGLSVQTIKDIEGYRRWVSDSTLTSLAKALKTAEFQLLLPEKFNEEQKYAPVNLKALIKLKKTIKTFMDAQFEDAINDLQK